jgi:two-component system NarL family response regulator
LAQTNSADIVLIAVDSAETAVSTPMCETYASLRDQGTPAVLLNLADDDERLLDALAVGVRGIIEKNADGAHLVASLNEVISGEITISKRLASRLVIEYVSSAGERRGRSARGMAKNGDLSERELDVLSRLARGESNREIAGRMFISVHTVRAHVRSLMQKLHVHNRVQAATYALEHGLVTPGEKK